MENRLRFCSFCGDPMGEQDRTVPVLTAQGERPHPAAWWYCCDRCATLLGKDEAAQDDVRRVREATRLPGSLRIF